MMSKFFKNTFYTQKRLFSAPKQSGKLFPDAISALKASKLKSGDTICAGGFGLCGIPIGLIEGIKELGYNNLTIVSNNCGTDYYGNGLLLNNKQIIKMVSSYVGENDEFARQYLSGELEVDFTPQGTLAERLRAGGAGIAAFYTKTGSGTWIQEGKIPIKYDKDGKIEKYSEKKEVKLFDNVPYIMEKGITGEVAIVKASIADEFGNCYWNGSSRNFNPECAMAGKFTIVEAEKVVPIGDLKPEDVHLSGAFIDGIIENNGEKKIEILKYAETGKTTEIKDKDKKRFRIIKRAAQELTNNMVVNLGIGMPTLVPQFLDKNTKVWLQSENGLLGVGPYPNKGEENADLINAGKETVTLLDGASIFSSSESFAMINGGHVDVTILGSMEVSQFGDIANWIIPGKFVKGMGGAMNLVVSGSKVIATLEHCDKKGNSKIVKECTLPLTGQRCVSKIITDLCVFEVDWKNGLTLTELLDGTTLEQVKKSTIADFQVSKNLKNVELFP